VYAWKGGENRAGLLKKKKIPARFWADISVGGTNLSQEFSGETGLGGTLFLPVRDVLRKVGAFVQNDGEYFDKKKREGGKREM